MRRSCHIWNGCVPPPAMAMFSLSAHLTSASRISVSCPSTSLLEWQMPVETSIMLFVISGTTLPGRGILCISRSMSAA